MAVEDQTLQGFEQQLLEAIPHGLCVGPVVGETLSGHATRGTKTCGEGHAFRPRPFSHLLACPMDKGRQLSPP